MFRKLLALEIAALRQRAGEVPDLAHEPQPGVFAALRDAATPGIWTLRRPV